MDKELKFKRTEIINHTGEEIIIEDGGNQWLDGKYDMEVSIQDNGTTLKLFISNKKNIDKTYLLKFGRIDDNEIEHIYTRRIIAKTIDEARNISIAIEPIDSYLIDIWEDK